LADTQGTYLGALRYCQQSDEKKNNCIILRNLKKRQQEKVGIYERFQWVNFESIEKRGIPNGVKEPYARVKKYADNLKENAKEGRGLILKGPVGTMKTTLAIAVLDKWIFEHQLSGLFITMSSLLDQIFTLKAHGSKEWADFEEKLKTVNILVMDDLGREHHEGWVLTKLDAIINERYMRQKPIIATTNLSVNELRNRYAEHIMDRLRETSEVVNFTGKSLRKPAGGS